MCVYVCVCVCLRKCLRIKMDLFGFFLPETSVWCRFALELISLLMLNFICDSVSVASAGDLPSEND